MRWLVIRTLLLVALAIGVVAAVNLAQPRLPCVEYATRQTVDDQGRPQLALGECLRRDVPP